MLNVQRGRRARVAESLIFTVEGSESLGATAANAPGTAFARRAGQGANLEEAGAGQTKKDFIAKMCIVRKESREARYWLRLLNACYEPYRNSLRPLLQQSDEIVAIVSAIVRNAQSNPHRGRDRDVAR